MTSLADGLPPEIAAQIHPAWRANERAYWATRNGLLAEHTGRWVAFADGAVVAAGPSPVEVLHASRPTDLHPYITRVGFEDEPIRMRRATFPFDATYPGPPLPQLAAEFRGSAGRPGPVLDQVIPDTGADGTTLPWGDCQLLGLTLAAGVPSRVGGVGASSAITFLFAVWVVLDGTEHPCQLHADFAGHERLLGRDVLNQVDVLFRGPARQVVVNP